MTVIPTTGHIGLNVTELDRSLAFYGSVFGLRIQYESADPEHRFALLEDAGRLVLTLWQQGDGQFAAGTPGLHHLSFEVADLAEVRLAETRVRQAGGTLIHDGPVAHAEGADSGGIYFTDPDGIRLEIYAPAGVAGQPAPSGQAPTCGFF